MTIKDRMKRYIEIGISKKYIDINYEEDALDACKYIYPSKNEDYVDSDLYSPLLYKTWGELLKKKDIIESYSVIFKDYRYVLKVEYVYEKCQKTLILGSDCLLSKNKCVGDIKEHRYIGGFALWPSHRGGINFRKNWYNDDIFKTLEDIEKFYLNTVTYKGVIPERDYEWFNYLNEKGGFIDIFFFRDYGKYKELLDFENYRTEQIINYMSK